MHDPPRFRILAPIEVNGSTRHVPRGRTLSLLTLLATHRGAVVHVNRVIDQLCEGARPVHGKNAVHPTSPPPRT